MRDNNDHRPALIMFCCCVLGVLLPIRRRPLPLEGEVSSSEPEPRIRVEVVHHHRRHGPTPQRIVIVVAMIVLGIVLLRARFGLLMLAVLVPANLWIAMAVTVAALFIISIYERWRGRPF